MTAIPNPSTLAKTLSDVLADLAFMPVSEESRDASELAGATWLEAGISYSGAARGGLRLRCTQEFALALAGNLLGMDVDDPEAEAKAQDALKEMLNIVCGQVLTTTHGFEPIFDLTAPTCRTLPLAPTRAHGAAPSAVVYVEGWPVQLEFLERVPACAV